MTGSLEDSPTPLMDVAQMQYMLLGLHRQVQEYSSVFSEMMALKDKLHSMEQQNISLQSENEILKKKPRPAQLLNYNSDDGIRPLPAKIGLKTSNGHNSPNNGPTTPKLGEKDLSIFGSTWADKTAASTPKRSAAPTSHKKRVSAARAFQSLEFKGEQGFAYVYLGRSRKITRSEVRSRLRRSGVDTGRILDVSFPASGVLGVLMHVQYVKEFTATMKKVSAQVFDTFDPILSILRIWPIPNGRAQQMHSLVYDRAIDSLSFLRPLLVGPVARSFLQLGWIDEDDLTRAISAARSRLAKVDPRKAAFHFKLGSDSSEPLDSSHTDHTNKYFWDNEIKKISKLASEELLIEKRLEIETKNTVVTALRHFNEGASGSSSSSNTIPSKRKGKETDTAPTSKKPNHQETLTDMFSSYKKKIVRDAANNMEFSLETNLSELV
ncbi:hypothetical protein BD770DRAFT_407172 [Pilaira anomala]|nr:hypothetical protein BD770DRAFT_407172 [Pilaira anomala]